MQNSPSFLQISVTWRKKKFLLEMDASSTVKELGKELQKLTNTKEDTMRLIIPQISNQTSNSKLLSPFSAEHAYLSLQEASITEGKMIRMMGVSENEVDEVLQNEKDKLRVLGFEDEENRLKLRLSKRPNYSLKLPQGPYIFCDFHTLELPGVELYPPPSEALKRMHMLASDPGIVAIMKKHRWRVGMMTEMEPVGYVGVSPKCLLGFNKNHGEEISLRLRTDDLKGFRKYETIKRTLLHELAHMVYSEHDSNFYALDKQLNEEAASLDWTRSRSHTLGGVRHAQQYHDEFETETLNVPQKLGGNRSDELASARASSVAAAYLRQANTHFNNLQQSEAREEPDPDDSATDFSETCDKRKSVTNEEMEVDTLINVKNPSADKSDSDNYLRSSRLECDPEDYVRGCRLGSELGSNDFKATQSSYDEEPDPDDLETSLLSSTTSEICQRPELQILGEHKQSRKTIDEQSKFLEEKKDVIDDYVMKTDGNGFLLMENKAKGDHHLPGSLAKGDVLLESDPDDGLTPPELSSMEIEEQDPDDQELQRIQDPVNLISIRLQKSIEMLRSDVSPMEATTVLQTLFKIVRNVIEHPDETKYRRLRKSNPIIKKNIANYRVAMEVLQLIGFSEDVVHNEVGNAESYLILKRNDPGLLWLARSYIETYI